MTPESKHFMAGLLMAAVLIAGIAIIAVSKKKPVSANKRRRTRR